MLGEHLAVVGSNSCSSIISWVTLGELINFFLLFPPHPLRVRVKMEWEDAHEGINVNMSCALNHGRQWVDPLGSNGVFHLSPH